MSDDLGFDFMTQARVNQVVVKDCYDEILGTTAAQPLATNLVRGTVSIR